MLLNGYWRLQIAKSLRNDPDIKRKQISDILKMNDKNYDKQQAINLPATYSMNKKRL